MKALLCLLVFLPSLAFADVSVPRSKQYLWTQYDVSQLGGESTAHALGADLPQGAIITDVYVYINTPFVSQGSGSLGNDSLAFQCAGTRDLMDYQGMSNSAYAQDKMIYAHVGSATANDSAALVPVNSSVANLLNVAQGFGSVPSDCSMTAVVRGNAGFVPYASGKATVIVEYFRK